MTVVDGFTGGGVAEVGGRRCGKGVLQRGSGARSALLDGGVGGERDERGIEGIIALHG